MAQQGLGSTLYDRAKRAIKETVSTIQSSMSDHMPESEVPDSMLDRAHNSASEAVERMKRAVGTGEEGTEFEVLPDKVQDEDEHSHSIFKRGAIKDWFASAKDNVKENAEEVKQLASENIEKVLYFGQDILFE